MTTETNELADYVRRLVERTAQGDIGWSPISPSSYASVRDTASGKKRMTLTRAKRAGIDKKLQELVSKPGAAIRDADLLFQVESFDPLAKTAKGVELAIDTREKPELFGAFEELFSAAKSSVDAQSARILKELVG
jgi:hypothetical protein